MAGGTAVRNRGADYSGLGRIVQACLPLGMPTQTSGGEILAKSSLNQPAAL